MPEKTEDGVLVFPESDDTVQIVDDSVTEAASEFRPFVIQLHFYPTDGQVGANVVNVPKVLGQPNRRITHIAGSLEAAALPGIFPEGIKFKDGGRECQFLFRNYNPHKVIARVRGFLQWQ